MATIAEALQIAADYHLSGRLQEAGILYRRILDADPEQPDALHLLGVLCAQSGQYADAASLIMTAIRHRPDQPDYHQNLGNALRALGRNHEAGAVFRRAAALRPEHFDSWDGLAAVSDDARTKAPALRRALALNPRQRRLWGALGDIAADAGRFDELGALLLRLSNLLVPYGIFWKTPYYIVFNIANRLYNAGNHAAIEALFQGLDPILPRLEPLTAAWMGFLKASWHTARGELAQAQAIFDEIAPTLPLVRTFSLGRVFEERTVVDPAEWAAYEATMHDHGPAASGDGPVLLCAADGAYTERFAPLFLTSADVFARQGLRVHLHVVNPGPGTLDLLTRLRAGLSRIQLAVTWEEAGQDMAAPDRMTYYTCVRFLRLPALMDRYRAPMVVSDIDAVWLADPGAFTDALSAAEPLALVRNPDTLAFLYDAVAGGVVALTPQPGVRDWAGDVARFLFHWFRRRDMEYFLDQVALVSAVDWHETRGRLSGIRTISIADSVYRLGDGVVYQILGGKRDPEFDRRVAAILSGGATPDRIAAFVADDQALARQRG